MLNRTVDITLLLTCSVSRCAEQLSAMYCTLSTAPRRDKGLVTYYGEGEGGLRKRRGACEVLPPQKGGGGAVTLLAMLKGDTTSFEVVFTR